MEGIQVLDDVKTKTFQLDGTKMHICENTHEGELLNTGSGVSSFETCVNEF